MAPSNATHASTRPSQGRGIPLEPGMRIADRFEVQALAGAGGMGEVYRSWDSVLERTVALKVVRPREGEADEYLERFRREALALAQLNHPHVCQVYDLVLAPEGTFIAMEWLEGETLEVVAKTLSRKDKLRVLWEASEGLAAAHAKGLVHRDLKPGNLIITPEGTLKILDFGLARLNRAESVRLDPHTPVPLPVPEEEPEICDDQATALERPIRSRPTLENRSTEHLTQQGYFMGSPRYASPEQIRSEIAEAPSDVFSLGILAWELLTGGHPFPGEGRERFKAVVENRRLPLKTQGLPRAVAQLLEAMLQSRPPARPSSAEVAQVLRKAQSPLRPIWWAGLGALLALALGALGFLVMTRSVVADLTREHPARVAILPVRNKTGEATLDSELQWVLPDLLALGLQGQKRLTTIPSSSVNPVIKQFGLPPDPPSPERLKRLAAPLGADLFLFSTLEPHDGGWRLRYRLIDLKGQVRTEGAEAKGGPEARSLQALARGAAMQIAHSVQPLGHRPEGTPISVAPEALRRFAEGKELMMRGQFQEALEPLRLAAELAPHFGPAAVQWGLCLRKTGKPGALAAIQWGRWAARSANLQRTEIQALTELSLLRMDAGDWDQARVGLEEAMALAQSLGDEDFQSALLNNQAFLAMERKHYAVAEPLLHRALLIQRRLGKRSDEILTLNNLAILAKERGDFTSAQTHYTTVLEEARQLEDRWTESVCLNNLGDVALCRLDFADAEAKFRAALAVKEKIGNRAGLIIPIANLGILARVQGRWDEGRTRLEEALALCRELDRVPLESIVRYQQGALELAAGRPREAQPCFQAAFDLGQKLSDPSAQAQALAGLAEAALLSKDLSRAESSLRLAREKQVDSPLYWRAEGMLRLAKGEQAGAKQCLERALQLARKSAPEESPGIQAKLAQLR